MGHHDVGGLQVAMDNLLVVHVFQGVHQLLGYLVRHLCRQQLLLYKVLQRVSIYVFHHDGSSQVFYLFQAYCMADIGMLQLQTYLKLLGQSLTVNRRVEKVVLEAFQHVALAVSRSREDAGVA